MTKIIELIITKDCRWTWAEWNSYRKITQLYTKEWKLVWEVWYENEWDITFLNKNILDNI